MASSSSSSLLPPQKQKQTRRLTAVERMRAQFEQKIADGGDADAQAAAISASSDRKKYNFVGGLDRDLASTRAVLLATATPDDGDGANTTRSTTFGRAYQAGVERFGAIANLNKTLQNLAKQGEIAVEREIFFQGQDDDQVIRLLPGFAGGLAVAVAAAAASEATGDAATTATITTATYRITTENAFRPEASATQRDVPIEERLGRSYVNENLATRDVKECAACGERVADEDRFVVRGRLFHAHCLPPCAQCGAKTVGRRDMIANVAFDGSLCCSANCIRLYDAANEKQRRG